MSRPDPFCRCRKCKPPPFTAPFYDARKEARRALIAMFTVVLAFAYAVSVLL